MRNILLCHIYQLRLDAYLDGELNKRMRQRVGRHIDRCPVCYDAYMRRRELKRELQQSVSLLGYHDAPDFAALWGAVRAELPRKQGRPHKFRYGLVMLLLLLALVVPFTMGNSRLARALPEQAIPPNKPISETPEHTEPALAVTAVAASTREGAMLFSTPPTLPEPYSEKP